MNPNAQFERDLEQWLQTEAPASAPAGFHASVMDRARTLRQRPGWATSLPVRRFGRGRGMTLLAAAALLLVGGALRRAPASCGCRPSSRPCLPHPSAVLATASPDATTTPSPSASRSPSPAPLSLDLTWTQVPDAQSPRLAWIGDRFVLVDVKSGCGPYLHRRPGLAGTAAWRRCPELHRSAQGVLRELAGQRRRVVEPPGS